MVPPHRSRAVLACAALVALSALVVWRAGEDVTQPPSRAGARAASGIARSAAALPPAPPLRAPQTAAPASAPSRAETRDPTPVSVDAEAHGERALLARALAEALPGRRSARDLDRLAELALQARDLRGVEAPAREREILLALSVEFERLAGAPMGDVLSRLASPDDLPPERARRPDAEPTP